MLADEVAQGAYGDDHASRPELVKIAQGRARERIGSRFDNAGTVLIGDTPNDVQAALTAGVRVVAVATGKELGGRAAGGWRGRGPAQPGRCG
ncbi:HAD hydrolase-like protein [Saccharothrix sp. AJ9571]|nr:HAD hydrolase-like protein [Saccharothrix sp. AJ9571]